MQYVYLVLNWAFGVLFFLTGLLFLADSVLASFCLISISLLLLPPVRKFVYSKTKKDLSVKYRTASIFALFVAFSVFVNQAQDRKEQELAAQKAQVQAEKAEKARQDKIDYFNNNRDEILSRANSALSAKNYQEVIDITGQYLVSGDGQLSEVHNKAKAVIAEQKKAEKTQLLLAKLKTVPASEFEENKKLYQQLSAMHPANETYKNKLAHYEAKIEEEKQAKIAAAARKERIEKQFSAWDGSHYNLERIIKKAMNDPDSYEHDETVYWDRGDHLIVRTTYRGKNAFGGVVRNFVKAKVSLDGVVLQIIDQT
ncbi:MAG: hypothetical protein ACRBB6_11930 [Neptuniibacter sp.]